MFFLELNFAVVISLFLIVALLLFSRKRSLPKSFPPGPIGFPLIGYLPYLGNKPHQVLFDLRKKYGPVVSVQLGTKLVVVLNSLETIKEALGKFSFSGRPIPMPFRIENEGIGIVSQNGQEWREQRQFSFKVLQTLGFGKVYMEDYVKEEIFCLLEHLSNQGDQGVNLVEVLAPRVSNIINALTIGKRLEMDDPKRKLLNVILEKMVPCFRQLAGVYFLPMCAQKLFKTFNNVYKEGRKYLKLHIQLLEEEIENHSKELDPSGPKDYIDMYLLKMNKTKESNPFFHKSNLIGNLRVLALAGTDTTLVALEWALLAMASYPEIQERVLEEVDSVIGQNRTPSYSDQSLMPYTHSTILETHRWRTNLPLNVLRRTTSATSVGGFNLPADTTVVANLWAVHNDPDLWDSPEDFRPERFISEDTGLVDVNKSDMLATFTFGPRSCPGKALANLEVFLFFVSILQRFRVTSPEGINLTLDGVLEISYKPLHTQLVFRKR